MCSSKNNEVQKICIFCHKPFTPNPKTKDRQYACSEYECQRKRQAQNQADWLKNNPVDYQQWYIIYGKPYREKNPNYQREHRAKRKNKLPGKREKSNKIAQLLLPFPVESQNEKKEELTSLKSIGKVEKKEELTPCFLVVKIDNSMIFPLSAEKKEGLTNCFYSP